MGTIPAGHKGIIYLIFSLSGFCALIYEILWTRVFLLFFGNTSYAFSLMLSSYLIGIALGGALYARLVHPDFDEKTLCPPRRPHGTIDPGHRPLLRSAPL